MERWCRDRPPAAVGRCRIARYAPGSPSGSGAVLQAGVRNTDAAPQSQALEWSSQAGPPRLAFRTRQESHHAQLGPTFAAIPVVAGVLNGCVMDSVPARCLLPCLLAFGLGGCASLGTIVPRADMPPPPATTSSSAVARQLTVQSHRGRLGPEARAAMLQRVGEQGKASLMQRHLAAMASVGPVQLHAGNEAKLLIDGPATFAAMFQAIERARSTVLLESYIVEHAPIAQKLAALLKRKREQGVQVAMLYDALGSRGTDRDYFDGLAAAGIAVCSFNPVGPSARPGYWDIMHRDHRKILVVDRETSFTGGINISAVYSLGSFSRRSPAAAPAASAASAPADEGWRDTQILLRGSAAVALEDLLRETWRQQGCRGVLPPPAGAGAGPVGEQLVRIVPSTPDDEYNQIYAMLLSAIDASQRSVHLTMAYFAPGRDMVDALCEAAQRGVDVQLILPSISDFTPVLYAGRSYYTRLLKAGVKIHELQDAVLHAKTAVIDGVVSTVGSSNLDWRSFTGNNEVNAVVIGEDFGGAMTRMFERDLQDSQSIEPAAWARRPLWHRLRETAARLFERWW